MTKLAYLISKMEGFGKVGKTPTIRHNPGDLRHSPHSSHTVENPNAIGIIDTDAHGWEDLERQLQLYAKRDLTLAEMINEYAPNIENNTQNYLNFILSGLNLPANTKVGEVLKIKQEKSV